MRLIVVILTAVLFLGGCRERKISKVSGSSMTVVEAGTSLLQPRYARGFHWEQSGQDLSLILADPWNPGRIFARYRIVKAGTSSMSQRDAMDIPVPVTSLAASSTTHAAFLCAIDARDILTGCNNPEKLFDPVLYDRFVKGDLVRMGRDLEYNLEYLVAKKPGLVLQSGIEGQFNPDPRLAEIGIPVLYILEWMEPTPLGRSEWIRVFGMLTGKVREADSIFAAIEKDYLALSALGHNSPVKPLVLTGTDFKGTWYMPGGRNYQARFFEDAGMEYHYKLTKQSASLAFSFETVVNDLNEAPVWVGTTTDSLSQLLAAEERYAIFRAVKNRKVYSITNRVNMNGGNDYWESGVVRPDKVLADLLFIAHPELLPGHAWNYYKPMIFN